jgi:hypothetical protein
MKFDQLEVFRELRRSVNTHLAGLPMEINGGLPEEVSTGG